MRIAPYFSFYSIRASKAGFYVGGSHLLQDGHAGDIIRLWSARVTPPRKTNASLGTPAGSCPPCAYLPTLTRASTKRSSTKDLKTGRRPAVGGGKASGQEVSSQSITNDANEPGTSVYQKFCLQGGQGDKKGARTWLIHWTKIQRNVLLSRDWANMTTKTNCRDPIGETRCFNTRPCHL